MKRLRNVAVGVGLIGMTLSIPLSAQAQPAAAGSAAQPDDKKVAEAKSRYKAGLALYDDGAYEAARVQFERAYELAPSYKILYNVGLVYKQLNEFVGALKALEQYLSDGGNEVPADRKTEVNKLIESLRTVIASADVTVNTPGAEITVDDAVVGTAPLSKPVLLNPGRRKVGAKMAGKIPDNKVITVASGDTVSISLALQEAVVINKGTDVKPILAWAIAGGLAVGAGVTGFLANNASNDREDALKRRDATRDELNKAVDKQKTLALVSDILTITTVVAVGVAVYFTWIRKGPKSDTKTEDSKAAGIRIRPSGGSFALTF